jgi:hypothetical protein
MAVHFPCRDWTAFGMHLFIGEIWLVNAAIKNASLLSRFVILLSLGCDILITSMSMRILNFLN